MKSNCNKPNGLMPATYCTTPELDETEEGLLARERRACPLRDMERHRGEAGGSGGQITMLRGACFGQRPACAWHAPAFAVCALPRDDA